MIKNSVDTAKENRILPITLALIAHDNKKEEMLSLAEDHRESLSKLSRRGCPIWPRS
ncbi:hypothetical protein [Dehalogenimonas etheniformans]|uniref:hypothetical protein n=1 Tax=Dehalogenimonas etheniformans TaxID=1536648 RepID=UPI00167F5666|nr:hypothetical protein [Dehalogenimonas etheniformans]QNT76910.1 hypothetical protein HX448_09605 [Dehalogenimonas etheniformans]